MQKFNCLKCNELLSQKLPAESKKKTKPSKISFENIHSNENICIQPHIKAI